MIQRIMIADYNQLLNTPIENKDLSSFSPKDASDNKIYHHLGATTEKLEHNGLYRSDGSNWIALDSTEELQKYQQKLTAGPGITIDSNNVISASEVTAGAIQVETQEQSIRKCCVLLERKQENLSMYGSKLRTFYSQWWRRLE